jgi:hypothetical protein
MTRQGCTFSLANDQTAATSEQTPPKGLLRQSFRHLVFTAIYPPYSSLTGHNALSHVLLTPASSNNKKFQCRTQQASCIHCIYTSIGFTLRSRRNTDCIAVVQFHNTSQIIRHRPPKGPYRCHPVRQPAYRVRVACMSTVPSSIASFPLRKQQSLSQNMIGHGQIWPLPFRPLRICIPPGLL